MEFCFYLEKQRSGQNLTVCYGLEYYHIRGTFGGNFNLAVWRLWLRSPNLMYANTVIITCIMKRHEALQCTLKSYYPVRQTEMYANVHYVPIHQTYCSPCIRNAIIYS